MDGAFFGTTFPHLLLMTYPSIRPQRQPEQYVPRVFGFKLHSSALAIAEGSSSSAHTNSVTVSFASARLSLRSSIVLAITTLNTRWRGHHLRSLAHACWLGADCDAGMGFMLPIWCREEVDAMQGSGAANNRNCVHQHTQQARKREDESGPSQSKSNQRRHT